MGAGTIEMIKIMQNIFHKKAGQATTELAVMGTIILLIFGMLLRYGQILDMKQWAQMYSFRTALNKAKDRNRPGSAGCTSATGCYAGATVVAMPEVYSINPMGIDRTPTFVSAAGSANFDIHQNRYVDDEGTPDRASHDWIPETYYQVGNRMINEHRAVMMPLMLVKRTTARWKVGRNDPITVLSEATAACMEDDCDEAKDYYSAEAVPVEKVIMTADAAMGTRYHSEENPSRSIYEETSAVGYNQTFEYVYKTPERIFTDSHDGGQLTTMKEAPTRVPAHAIIKLDKRYESSRDSTTPR